MARAVDEFSHEVPGTRVASDNYTRNQKLPDGHKDKLPDPDDFHRDWRVAWVRPGRTRATVA